MQLHREMQVGYCRLVTISTDNLIETNEFRAGVGAHWTFLSDPGRKLQKDLDIAEYSDPDHNPMIPHALVLEPRDRRAAVGVDVRHDVGCGDAPCGLTSDNKTLPRLVDDAHAGHCASDVARSVGTRVVDDDDVSGRRVWARRE